MLDDLQFSVLLPEVPEEAPEVPEEEPEVPDDEPDEPDEPGEPEELVVEVPLQAKRNDDVAARAMRSDGFMK
jgi:hypothetical protein